MTISKLAEQYNQFQHAFGQGDVLNYENMINALFSPKFKKVANGNELVSERTQLLSQLMTVKDFAGKWSIQKVEIIPAQDGIKCTIRYFLNSEKARRFEVIAILSASHSQIDRIDEIYYQEAS